MRHLDQGTVLELAHGGLAGLQRVQPGHGRLSRIDAHAQRQRIDEHTDHALDAGQFGRAARQGRAAHHVFFAAGAAQQDGPGAQDERVHSQLMLPCPGLQRGRGRGVECHLRFGRGVRTVCHVTTAVARQRSGCRDVGQHLLPKRRGCRLILLV